MNERSKSKSVETAAERLLRELTVWEERRYDASFRFTGLMIALAGAVLAGVGQVAGNVGGVEKWVAAVAVSLAASSILSGVARYYFHMRWAGTATGIVEKRNAAFEETGHYRTDDTESLRLVETRQRTAGMIQGGLWAISAICYSMVLLLLLLA